MNKNQLCWLLVRMIGVCLVFNGLRYTLIVIENILAAPPGEAGQLLLSHSAGLLGGWCLQALASFVAGAYLIKRGKILFLWLSAEADHR
jgi:hypothetical protein